MNDNDFLIKIYEDMQANENINIGDLINFDYKFKNNDVYGLVIDNPKEDVKMSKTGKNFNQATIDVMIRLVNILEDNNIIKIVPIEGYANNLRRTLNPKLITKDRNRLINGKVQQIFNFFNVKSKKT